MTTPASTVVTTITEGEIRTSLPLVEHVGDDI